MKSTLIISLICLIGLSACDDVVSAPGRVVHKTLDTDNIIMNYELFHDEDQNYKARVNQIQEHQSDLKTETDKGERSRLRMEMEAQQQSCREIVADYNSNSRKYNREIFKDRGLPHDLDPDGCEINPGDQAQ